jgi:hypothetical protein
MRYWTSSINTSNSLWYQYHHVRVPQDTFYLGEALITSDERIETSFLYRLEPLALVWLLL